MDTVKPAGPDDFDEGAWGEDQISEVAKLYLNTVLNVNSEDRVVPEDALLILFAGDHSQVESLLSEYAPHWDILKTGGPSFNDEGSKDPVVYLFVPK